MTVERLPATREARSEWDAFVARSPAGSVFATSAYLDILGARYDLWVLRKNGIIDCGLPLVRGAGGLKTNPLYCKYLGLLPAASISGKPAAAVSSYYAQVEAFAELLRSAPSFDYAFHPAITNWMPFYWLGFRQQTHFTYVLPATVKETWWDAAESRLRNAARRAAKSGVTVRVGDCACAADVERCYVLSMLPFTSRRARPLMSPEKFARLVAAMGANGMGRIWFAEQGGNSAAAAALVFYDWKSAYFVSNGTLPTAATGTNSALLVHIIKDAHARGLDFDFEGSMIKMVETYYRGFAPELRPYSRIWRPSAVNFGKRLAISAVRRFGGYER